MVGIDYIISRMISGGYRCCYRQWQVIGGAGKTEVAMARMLSNKEASQELPQDYSIDCPTTKYYTTFIN